MKERELTALMAAIIFAGNRDDLHEDDALEEIRECVAYAEDILEELDRPKEEDETEVEVIQPRPEESPMKTALAAIGMILAWDLMRPPLSIVPMQPPTPPPPTTFF